MAKDSLDPILLGALGLGAWYLWSQSQKAGAGAGPTVIHGAPQPGSGQGMPIAEVLPIAAPQTSPGASIIQPIAQAVAGVTAALTSIPLLGPVAAAEFTVPATAISEQLGGNFSTGNVLTDVALALGPIAWGILAIGKLLHIDLFGHPLDPVNKILLNAFNSPITKDNVQFGQPIYLMDGDHVLHQVIGDVNKYALSWRAIIAVDQSVIDFFSKGAPIVAAVNPGTAAPAGTVPETLSYAHRPATADGIRAYFGCNAMFKISTDTGLYGPGSVLHPGDSSWELNSGYGIGRGCPAALSGSPAEIGAAQAVAARARF